MTWRVGVPIVLAGLFGACAPLAAQEARPQGAVLRQALIDALTPALPYPRARADGIPESGDAGPAWSVRWPGEGDEPGVEVIANPLNADTQARAAQAEQEAQAAVMRAQRRSQADYERALEEFARDGRVSPIREVTLEDEGVAGERFDAESELVVTLELAPGPAPVSILSSVAPVVETISERVMVVRVAPNTFRETANGQPSFLRFAPATARVYLGPFGSPSIARVGAEDRWEVTTTPTGSSAQTAVMVLSGNEGLLADVLKRADWNPILDLVQD